MVGKPEGYSPCVCVCLVCECACVLCVDFPFLLVCDAVSRAGARGDNSRNGGRPCNPSYLLFAHGCEAGSCESPTGARRRLHLLAANGPVHAGSCHLHAGDGHMLAACCHVLTGDGYLLAGSSCHIPQCHCQKQEAVTYSPGAVTYSQETVIYSALPHEGCGFATERQLDGESGTDISKAPSFGIALGENIRLFIVAPCGRSSSLFTLLLQGAT